MKKLLVIGGGFAGTHIIKKLEDKFDSTLIDTKNYFEYTPGILRAIINPDKMKKIQVLHSNYLKKAKLIIASVKEINKKYIIAGNKKLEYDYLVVCSGSDYDLPIKEQNIVIASRARHLQNSSRKLKKAKNILIIGGGLVGVELAAEICENYEDKHVTIVQLGESLIPKNNKKTISYVTSFLEKRGVKLLLNEKITKAESKTYTTGTGKKLKTDIAFLSTGIKLNSGFMRKNFSRVLNENNHIKVNDCLQILGQKNIFAAGDIIDVKEEKTAQNAENHAEIVAKNIMALEEKKQLKKYEPKKTALVISLGKYHGIFEYKNFVWGGRIPAFLKWLIEKWTMMKYN